jgi:catechol 2,3-dioxygenase-like lactoylglutathione lyase family enzyme
MKGSGLALLLVTGLGVCSSNPSPEVSGAFFALTVPDLAASTAWYRTALGLRVTREIPASGGVAVTILEGDGLIVELLQYSDPPPNPGPGDSARRIGIAKAGFLVRDFDRVLERLRVQGAELAYGPYPASAGQLANVIVRDNAGNLIPIFGR